MSRAPVTFPTKLLEWLKMYGRFERTPGFSTTALGLSLRDVTGIPNQNGGGGAVHCSNTLKLRYPMSHHLRGSTTTTMNSLATHAAVMDEVTTWALVLADPKRARGGVSVNLQAHRGPQFDRAAETTNKYNGEGQQQLLFDLEATVTKVGRNLGFVRAELFYSSDDNKTDERELVSYGSQIKYLPMGLVTDFALSDKGWPITKLYCEHFLKEPAESIIDDVDDDGVFESFQIETNAAKVGDILASFTATKAHASLGGTIHGGCQAVLMERTANEFLAQQQSAETTVYQLDSVSVDYLSTPSKQVSLRIVEMIPSTTDSCVDSNNLTLRVQLENSKDGRVSSEGLLRYVVPSTAPPVVFRKQ